MPLANVTQSLEARPTAQMFQEQRPRQAKRPERIRLSAERQNSSTKLLFFEWLAVRDDFRNWLVQNAA